MKQKKSAPALQYDEHMRVKNRPPAYTQLPTNHSHLQAMGTDAVAIKADMSNPADVEALFKETAAAFSDPVSILVRMRTTAILCCLYVCSIP